MLLIYLTWGTYRHQTMERNYSKAGHVWEYMGHSYNSLGQLGKSGAILNLPCDLTVSVVKSHVFRVNLLWVALLKHSSLVLLFRALISSRVSITGSEQLLSLYLSICYCLDLLFRERKLLAMSNLPRLRRQLFFPQNLYNNPRKD